jgi:phosphate transport system substrate-binding protein
LAHSPRNEFGIRLNNREKTMRIMNWAIAGLALAAITLTGCSREHNAEASERYLTIKGSDTMVHLVSTWAEEYMRDNPGTEISVTGGGSGTGVASLLNGTTQITASSRDMRESEFERAAALGITPVETAVALDGVAIVVNPENPVDVLTKNQLKAIYTGEISNWSQLGGLDVNILILSRESNSGTYVFFQEYVLEKQDYSVRARLMPATSSIIHSVEGDRGAIGYIGLGYAEDAGDMVKVVGVKADDRSDAIIPSVETVSSGAYTIARPLYFYTNGEPAGLAADFTRYVLGPEGQRIVQETGYVPIR